jgi:hypothetical protein
MIYDFNLESEWKQELKRRKAGCLNGRLAFCIWIGRFMRKMRWFGVGGTAVTLLFFIITSLAQAQGTPTPTVDRLAAPPTVLAPNQADEGAQLFWLYCQPCHGDKGQGLTDEWRAQFPEEDQYCWGSGCHGAHGKDQPEFGFIIPTVVPPVTGEDSLPLYQNMGQFFYYIRERMPLELPGRLTDEEYLAITAHIAREHGIWDGVPLTKENVVQYRLRPTAETTPEAPQLAEDNSGQTSAASSAPLLVLGGIGVLVIAMGGIGLWRRQGQRGNSV